MWRFHLRCAAFYCLGLAYGIQRSAMLKLPTYIVPKCHERKDGARLSDSEGVDTALSEWTRRLYLQNLGNLGEGLESPEPTWRC
jgi:hypothetical protein